MHCLGLINTLTQMRESIIFIDETLEGLYRKALNRHLKRDLFYYCLNTVYMGLNGSQVLPNAALPKFSWGGKEEG